ncbi:MAG: bifunctional demethylmenaquinone methyltransferase/2-methoxy-6-polyprenyl-1,4-benzoquinol methylase UbiE [Bacteroidetes bacterium CG_4_10_14_3_um_filter_31_20]|nr:bifunctional demethylmenaquinone methyltransferase/2-methoxy-6-polyprenyl-1,4-benzoquinol methylase UbiE [Bacteroidota bacterium]PIX36146.1 MAG: bifunctional demethylmenaquinone methyltransferase/2-methoxy-6-polyprenyl-1,4-benzoquinol methylase UbiE [Bacteroidetes bacterium CG_4_8_14_3_um_filter_31_14]PIY07026.1 MAG: bifunctional demethylmenaquinone methyltransferase/2-methoxy-6-polyprenyl-1,4-benzoquinol methylase UbiE [Bacteroidetes bacterium CG_4_10_14_3_um_filter_31_20]
MFTLSKELIIEKNKVNVESLFDDIAPSYDFLNHFLSANTDKLWRKKSVKILSVKNPKKILDVATGTGDLAIAMLKLEPEKIIGIDISKEMLEIGKKKIKEINKEQIIELQQNDAENIPFSNNSFDAVTIAFGVRNFENLNKGLSELYRVLNFNGTLLILEFSRPKNNLFGYFFKFYFKYILPTLGKMFSKNKVAYKYLFQSVQQFPSVNNMKNNLLSQGFINVNAKTLSMGIATIYTASK